jgi:predicted MFS family arabinose efflux permease
MITDSKNELSRNWLILLSASAGVICSSIVLPFYSIGALVIPITTEMGWSRAEFQLAILFSTGTGVLTAPIVGWMIDQYGARLLAISGLFGLSISFVAASFMNGELWMLYAIYTSIALLGAGTIPVTWTRAVTSLFFRQRGLALGIMLSGTGVCGMLVPQYTVWLVENFGWRNAYLGLALLPMLGALPLVFFFFHPGAAISSDPESIEANNSGFTLRQTTRNYRFWVLLLSILIVYMAMSGIMPNFIPALVDQGLSATDAAFAMSFFGAAVIAGRLIVGYLVDRLWAPAVAAVAIGLPVIGSLMLLGVPTFTTACIAAVLLGFAAGAELDLMSFLAARYFGLKHYSQIYAWLYAALALASGFAPMLFARIYDVTQSYDIGFAIAAVLFAIGALMLLLMGRYPTAFPTSKSCRGTATTD